MIIPRAPWRKYLDNTKSTIEEVYLDNTKSTVEEVYLDNTKSTAEEVYLDNTKSTVEEDVHFLGGKTLKEFRSPGAQPTQRVSICHYTLSMSV